MNLTINTRDGMPCGGMLTIDTGNATVDADSIAGDLRHGREARLRDRSRPYLYIRLKTKNPGSLSRVSKKNAIPIGRIPGHRRRRHP